MVRRLTISVPWLLALFVGLMLAAGAAPVVITVMDWYADWRDRNNPPATLQWYATERLDRDSMRITLLVTRHQDCQMVRAAAYTGRSLNSMQPASSFEREDGSAPTSYPVGITVISRPWLLHGIYGSKVAVSAYYECGGRIVKGPLLTGDVPEPKP